MTAFYSKCANFLFICFFPLFFFYHLGIAAGAFPPMLGGGFAIYGIIGCFLGIMSIPLWLSHLATTEKFTSFLWLSFLVLCVGYSSYYLFAGGEKYLFDAAIQSFQAIILILAMFFVGFFMDIESRILMSTLRFSLFLMFIFLVVYAFLSGGVMFYAREFFESENSVATYQGFARSALLTILPLLAVAHTAKLKLLIGLVGVYVLFVLGARSEFFSFLIWLIGFAASFILRSRWGMIFGLVALISVLFGVWSLSDLSSTSRQLEVTNLSESTSWVARQQLFNSTISVVDSSPLLGDFGAHIRVGGDAGSYSHNALSAWVNYGVVGFIFYILSIFSAFCITAYHLVFRNNACLKRNQTFSFSVLFFVLLLILISKPVFWPITGLAMGLYFKSTVKRQ